MNMMLKSFKPLLSYKYFFFDCDGVLWHGGKELFNSFNILRLLQKHSKDFFLLTNNSMQTQMDGANYIKSAFDYKLDSQRFISAAFLTAHYAKSRNYKRMYIIGGKAMFDEIRLTIKDPLLLGEHDNEKTDLDTAFFDRFKGKENVDAVFVGKDSSLNYYKLAYAICSVNKGADLVAAHCNLMYRKNQLMIPNCGTTIRAIEAATGKKALDLGKPGNYGIKTICEKFNINFEKEKRNMLIIGDNVGVEIKLGNDIGIDSVLVLSGNTTKDNLLNELNKNQGVRPTHVIPYLTYESI